MTFWGFLFAVLIVFVALYAWNRFRHTGDAADLGDMMFGGNDNQQQRAQGGARRHDVVVNANRPMLAETGTIGEFDDPIQQAPMQQKQMQGQQQGQGQQTRARHAGQQKSRDLSTQLYLSEIGSIGDVTRQPVALLPAPQGESGSQGQMSANQGSVQSYGQDNTQASAQEAAQVFTQSSAQGSYAKMSAQASTQDSSQTLTAQEHGYSSAVASESIGSNLSHQQGQVQSYQAQNDAEWLENSDLERLNNAGNANNRYQGANFDATYGDNATTAGSYMQAQTASFQTEVGTIGEQQQNQAPYAESQAQRAKQQRRGYIHKSNVEFGSQADMEGLYNLPDQLPVLNNTNFNDPNCK